MPNAQVNLTGQVSNYLNEQRDFMLFLTHAFFGCAKIQNGGE